MTDKVQEGTGTLVLLYTQKSQTQNGKNCGLHSHNICLFPDIPLTKAQTDENIYDIPILASNALQRPLTVSLRGSKLKSYLNSNTELNSSSTCEHFNPHPIVKSWPR